MQEAFKPSQVFPELILALYLKHLQFHKFWIKSGTKSVILFWENRLLWVLQSYPKQRGPKMAGLCLCRLGASQELKPLLYRAINFPINYKAIAVLGYDLGDSRLSQGYHQAILAN